MKSQFTRRKAMQTIALAALSMSSSMASAKTNEKIVVVGAGFAGIGAARFLQAQGAEVEVIEARPRLGGRTHSKPTAYGHTDLGAAWLHGSPNNPLYPIALAMQQATQPTNFLRGEVVSQIGRTKLADPEVGLPFGLVWPAIQWYLGGPLGFGPPETSVASVVERLFSDMPADQACALKSLYEVANAAELDQTSVLSQFGLNGDDPFGEVQEPVDIERSSQDALMLGGMQNFLSALAKDISVSLDEPVLAIEWGSAPVTIVTTKREIKCDRVILTASVGVLKDNLIKFMPELPSTHQGALDGFGMGLLNKVVLEFPSHMPTLSEEQIIHLCADAPVNFVLNGPALNQGQLISGLSGGKKSQAIETLRDEDLVHSLKRELDQMHGAALPDPTNVWVTRWGQDRWASGSYSFYNMKISGDAVKNLRKPLGDRVFLAGEALSVASSSTVHGAFHDGQRAAADVLALSGG